jgi:cytochrome c1
VTETRTGAYIMNMILNPAEMVQKHPEARAKLAEFMTPMPFQNVTEDEARDILEYLRSQNNNQ